MALINNDYYSADEFAAAKNVHVKTVYRWVKGRIGPIPECFAGMLWFEKKAADAFTPPSRGRRKARQQTLPSGKE